MTKILLVEDDELNRDMLLRRLERKGMEVEIAVNGREAVGKSTPSRRMMNEKTSPPMSQGQHFHVWRC